MGKPTGFLEFDRCENEAEDPAARTAGFGEFHHELSPEKRREQGARCMNCGVPFCQSAVCLNGMVSGCPLHNLIPEWNDEISNGNWEQALSRLTKTASFPEFTGRVCPALCEAACTNGLYGSPVTVRENELAIIEYGYRNGLMQPQPPKVRSGKQVAVVGSGPAGLAAADRLNRRGHEVTVYEKADRIGGLLMYGIPQMKLEKAVVERRVKLMEQEGVRFVTGVEVGADIAAKELLERYDAVVLCGGAGNPRDLAVPGREAEGVYFAVDFLTSTTRALLDNGLKDGYISAKDKDVIIVGGGDTGNDCVGTVLRHGCRSVVQLEMMPPLPETRAENNPWPQWPRVKKTDYGQQEAIARFGVDPRVYSTTVKELRMDEQGRLCGVVTVSLVFETDETTGRRVMREVPGSETERPCQQLLIAAGFLGPRPELPHAFGVECTKRSTVATADGGYATNVPKVFTAGDMHRGQSLVVWAISEGRAAAKEVDAFLMGYTDLV